MIRAAALAAVGGSPPPPLWLLWMTQSNPGALPDAGGLRDQDAQTMASMNACSTIYSAITKLTTPSQESAKSITSDEEHWIEVLQGRGVLDEVWKVKKDARN